mmetsp:Transcript_47294/g.88617  ORF Transcript_47294/g.88617 Transcript_47294/m.88617 type:complete len:117 (-) Transcript_47294:727-1077(-)
MMMMLLRPSGMNCRHLPESLVPPPRDVAHKRRHLKSNDQKSRAAQKTKSSQSRKGLDAHLRGEDCMSYIHTTSNTNRGPNGSPNSSVKTHAERLPQPELTSFPSVGTRRSRRNSAA